MLFAIKHSEKNDLYPTCILYKTIFYLQQLDRAELAGRMDDQDHVAYCSDTDSDATTCEFKQLVVM